LAQYFQACLSETAKLVTSHFQDDLCSQSLDWCKNLVFPTNMAGTRRLNLIVTKLQQQGPKQQVQITINICKQN